MNLSKLDPNSEIGSALSIAQIAADSRLYKLNVPQATMQILAGRELGLGPVASIRGVHLVQGQTVLDYTVLAALVEASGTYEVETTPIKNAAGEVVDFDWSRTRCSLDFYKKNPDGSRRLIGRSVFDEEDAKLAKLLQKDNWKKHPKAMYQARAMSQGVRAHCPSVTMGSVYVPGEIPEPEPKVLPPQTFDTTSRPTSTQPAQSRAQPAQSVEATQVAERPAEPSELPAPRSAPTEQLPRRASDELLDLAARVRLRIPAGPLVRDLGEEVRSEELQALVEAARVRFPVLFALALRSADRQEPECAKCFGVLPCAAAGPCGGTRRAPAPKPLTAKERARAALDAEDAAAAAAAQGDPEADLIQAKASATQLASNLPPERRGRARAEIDCARTIEEVERLRKRVQAGLVQVENERLAASGSVDLGGLA